MALNLCTHGLEDAAQDEVADSSCLRSIDDCNVSSSLDWVHGRTAVKDSGHTFEGRFECVTPEIICYEDGMWRRRKLDSQRRLNIRVRRTDDSDCRAIRQSKK